jgi:hypothetical protein
VVSVLDGASRTTPWGIRLLEPTRRGGSGSWGSFAAGVGVSLIGLAVALLVRRRLARPSDPVAGAPDAATQPRVAEIARADLAAARAQLAGDPQRALDEASRALRRYAVRRFGGDAHVRTTEELALAEPPFLLTTRWPRFLALLSALDAARFSPTQADAAGAASGRARELFDQVESFVTDSSPAERDA